MERFYFCSPTPKHPKNKPSIKGLCAERISEIDSEPRKSRGDWREPKAQALSTSKDVRPASGSGSPRETTPNRTAARTNKKHPHSLTSFEKGEHHKKMTQLTKPISEAHCLTTNDHYRNTILTTCSECFTKAQSRQEFQTMMETIELLTNNLSDCPHTDQTFIHGATLALLTTKRWNK